MWAFSESRKALSGHDGVCVDQDLEGVRSGSGTHVLTLNTATVDRPSLVILAGRRFWNPVFHGECDHSRSVHTSMPRAPLGYPAVR